ncbi:2-haloacrylate reductase [bacterium HR17]|uniref:2-haloacrylate reductase n=1 Tax=Candidatus Fervidibacter japonicus TaxID=2035412 RepID=A0A2H5XAG5_9BACT|nr:2-haloacrylate reductase [bacterium HR17]
MAETMRAIVQVGTGGPEVLRLQEVPKPAVKPGHLLVRVTAVGVNYVDTMRRRGWVPVPPEEPYIPGIEVAGVVESVGEGVTSWQVGQRVMAWVPSGAYAEFCLVPHHRAMPVPDNLSDPEAAAVPVNWLTAYFALVTLGKLQPGERVLIHAAAGGVGTAAVQIAKLLGGIVFATAGSDDKVDLVRRLGADVSINYEQDDFEAVVHRHTDGQGVHLVLESVGGDVFTKSVRCLAGRGRLIVYGHASGKEGVLTSGELFRRRLTVACVAGGAMIDDPTVATDAKERVAAWLREGKVRPIVGEVHPLSDAGLAQHRLETRQTKGKVVLVP